MKKNIEHYESMFRQVTPLFLLGLLLAIVFEPWLPYHDWLVANFGEQIVLRVVVAFLVGYVLLLWGETLRLHGLLTGVLQAFKHFERSEGGATAGKAARNPKARLEAARLLVAAMRSEDASIRETSHHNLVRLIGKDLGAEPDSWQSWLDGQASE